MVKWEKSTVKIYSKDPVRRRIYAVKEKRKVYGKL